MDPLTMEELDAIQERTENSDATEEGVYCFIRLVDFKKLIAAARASIPRPIAEAPRDVILGVDAEGRWASCKYSQSSRCWFDAVGGCFFPIAWIPIPKGGTS